MGESVASRLLAEQWRLAKKIPMKMARKCSWSVATKVTVDAGQSQESRSRIKVDVAKEGSAKEVSQFVGPNPDTIPADGRVGRVGRFRWTPCAIGQRV